MNSPLSAPAFADIVFLLKQTHTIETNSPAADSEVTSEARACEAGCAPNTLKVSPARAVPAAVADTKHGRD